MALLRAISPNDPISTRAIDGLEETAPILQDAEFYTRGGPGDKVKKAGDSDDTELFRGLNEPNNPTPRDVNYDEPAKALLSYDATADVALEDRNESPEEELADQTYLESRNRGYILQEKFFEADSAKNGQEFDGLRVRVPSRNVVRPDSKIVLPLGGDSKKAAQMAAMVAIMDFIDRIPGGASHLYVNVRIRTRLLVVAKNLGFYSQGKDELGNTVDRIGDTIVRSAGRKKSGGTILPFDETYESAAGDQIAGTSSMFACRWAERADLSALTSVGMRGRYAGQQGNLITNNMNMDASLLLQDDNALHEHKGLALEA